MVIWTENPVKIEVLFDQKFFSYFITTIQIFNTWTCSVLKCPFTFAKSLVYIEIKLLYICR